MTKAVPIMVQGTSSDAGKSVLVTALCRIFAQDGYSTAPFKSQNMALNSYVTVDGKEIGRAQGVQAESAGIVATTDMNPILIKPSRGHEAQIVVHGVPYQTMQAVEYRKSFFQTGLQIITEAYQRLADQYDRVVIEGAGSPAEINLNDRELVNMRVARLANAPVILIADIERGGVFASLVGTLQLMEPADRERVIGVVINRFRGDLTLLQPGLEWFEQYTNVPVLGVIPFLPDLWIDAEDSLVLHKYEGHATSKKEIDIAVIQYPRISNFTDVDPFMVEPDCRVRYITRLDELGEPDVIILPGSKNTLEDMLFLQQQGLESRIMELHQSGHTFVIGLCGGYQMLGRAILDPYMVESPQERMEGLGLIPSLTTLEKTKTTILSKGSFGFDGILHELTGYEIHMGQTVYPEGNPHPFIQLANRQDGYFDPEKRVLGTYFHGLFHNDVFRHQLLDSVRTCKGLSALPARPSFVALREAGFDYLADQVRKHVQIERINEQIIQFQKKKEMNTTS
ncbi:cobyric acid synthase [Brevibacillus sp. SYSU BS000544]|uniref:cobyric acid synthase n=1 Tax=Brevibacillus sp. SYSU BS000544 TaxID=3416443 RepID=UPI003CE5A69F